MSQILSLLAIIGIGWLLRKFKLLKSEASSTLNTIAIMAAFPALIIISLNHSKLSFSMVKIAVPALGTPLLMCLIAYLVGTAFKLRTQNLGAFILVSSFGNTGFLGIPLAIKLLGEKFVPSAIFYDTFGTGVMVWLLGISIAIFFGSASKKTKLPWHLIVPPYIGVIMGVIFNGVQFPFLVDELLRSLSALTVPLIMISIGIMLATRKLSGAIFVIAMAAVLKLLVSPLVGSLLGSVVSLEALSARTVLLQASMPSALATAVIGYEYELSTDIVSGTILVTTLFTMLTTPLLLRLF